MKAVAIIQQSCSDSLAIANPTDRVFGTDNGLLAAFFFAITHWCAFRGLGAQADYTYSCACILRCPIPSCARSPCSLFSYPPILGRAIVAIGPNINHWSPAHPGERATATWLRAKNRLTRNLADRGPVTL